MLRRTQKRPVVTVLRKEKKEVLFLYHFSDMDKKEATARSDVDCKATDCMYNKDCQCHAGKISVEGGNACHCGETECATFKCGCA